MKQQLKEFLKSVIAIIYIPEIIILYFVGIIKYKELKDNFLVLERGDEARDNGFAFFEYLQKTKYKENTFYVITKNSQDIKKFESRKSIVEYKSIENKIAYIFSSCIIGTHYHTMSPWKYAEAKYINKCIFKRKKTIFLQHGIIKDDVSDYLGQKNVKFDIFICGAKKEYEYVKEHFGYKNNEIKYTGLARFDNLINNKGTVKKQVLLMPTWRGYLNNDEDFLKSDYYKSFNELLNSDEVIKLLNDFDYTLVFYPHYAMQKFIDFFKIKSDRIIIANKVEYDVQKLLIESKVLLTDYSSVFFDFAFMEKALVYYQFDSERFNEEHYKKGYFSYKDDGFGEVCIDFQECIKSLEVILRNDGEMNSKYVQRVNEFFELNDNTNCERILREIEKIL